MDLKKETKEEIPKETKPIRLTKKGLPDRRGETSRKNLEKGKSIIKEALKEIKTKQSKPVRYVEEEKEYSSDNYSTDEEEVNIEEFGKAPAPEPETPLPTSNGPIDYVFTFEKKLNEQVEKLNNEYTLKINDIEKKTKQELEELKKQNQALKKNITSNFRTHQGILNQEMYLKF